MSLIGAPVVAHVVRNGFVESVHHGLAVVTDAAGAVVHAVGDPATPVFPRSSFKPVQALGSLRAGAPVTGVHLALACASHSGEPRHLEGVRAILAASGLSVGDLRNTPDLPVGDDPRAAWLAAGKGKESLAQNCSGKHATMLAACVASGWTTDDYLDPGHPLQRLIRATAEEVTGEPIVATAVDGCGAPVHAFALAGLARAFGRFACANEGAERAIARAMSAHPEFVGGEQRPDTDLMRAVPGLIAKEGAEAVFAVGLPDGRGVAVKIADGSRAGRVVVAAILRELDVDAAACDALGLVPVLGHGERVGEVRAVVS
ncbi:asparaginase [Propioniciclava sp.]|uniref:asparaginase n=1 Tax=Propioniciclava sp. TaxID=2038686 RepID=UPI002627279F|nr:asparaginase [Propioniciclava sp.]